MKYIMFHLPKTKDTNGLFAPVIFPDILVHADVARHMKHHQLLGHNWVVDSAGFVDIVNGCHCHGKSETLNVASKPERDRLIIINYEYSKGIEGALDVFK
jgi:hypothetical protein